MTASGSAGNMRDDYLSTDEYHEAVSSLEMTAWSLEAAIADPVMWEWVVIALHNAVQGFMVLALQGSAGLGALRLEDRTRRIRAQNAHRQALADGDTEAAAAATEVELFGPARLASFMKLYELIKTPDWPMMQFTNSRAYEPRPTDDRCMKHLNDMRNEFAHFIPMTRGYLLTEFPALTETGLHIITFLLTNSRNVHLHDENLEKRADGALAQAKDSLGRLATDYAGLSLPVAPLCGAPAEEA